MADLRRQFDEAHLYRLLKAKHEQLGGAYSATDKALGLPSSYTQRTLAGMPINERTARALGFTRTLNGRRCGAHKPMKFIMLTSDGDSRG